MLRINFAQTEGGQRWTLCGQLMGPWVEELHDCWIRLREVAKGSRSIVDLRDVTFVDEGGEKLLSEMRSSGVEFVAAGVETRHLLENLKEEQERPLRRCISPLATGREKPRDGSKNGGNNQ